MARRGRKISSGFPVKRKHSRPPRDGPPLSPYSTGGYIHHSAKKKQHIFEYLSGRQHQLSKRLGSVNTSHLCALSLSLSFSFPIFLSRVFSQSLHSVIAVCTVCFSCVEVFCLFFSFNAMDASKMSSDISEDNSLHLAAAAAGARFLNDRRPYGMIK